MHGGLRRVLRLRLALFASGFTSAIFACGLRLTGELDVIPLPAAGAAAAPDVRPRPCSASPCVVDIGAGYSLTCAAMFDERPRCWGNNDAGQLGVGDLVSSSVPRVVKMGETATTVSAGGYADGTEEKPVACAVGIS